MTIRMCFFVTILLFMLCVGCLFGVMCVSAEDDNTIDTKLTLSGFSSGATRTYNNGVDYVAISNNRVLIIQGLRIRKNVKFAIKVNQSNPNLAIFN